MGNCQAIDAAAMVIQHPCGRIERLYWPIPASEVMRMNPGHYVSIIIPLPPVSASASASSAEEDNQHDQNNAARFTRVKLLRPTDTLALGHAYRLLTSQEVIKVLRAKKYSKTKRVESTEKINQSSVFESKSDTEKTYQVVKHERRHRISPTPGKAAAMRSKSWRPSLQSISEAAARIN